MRILGIETSCDETAVAIVCDGRLEDSVLSSQAELHSIFGGVVPELASREHYRFIGPLFDQLLERNSLKGKDIDAIAVTRGPGLLGSILVGLAFAKSLALSLNIPLVGVNHLHAHLLAGGLENPLIYPALGLLVSGGHTYIYRIHSPWDFEILGQTLDDAAGEAFDKTGFFLGLPYPAGKMIDDYGKLGTAVPALLPRPYLDNDNFNFSFSGIKTFAAQYIQKNNLTAQRNKLNDFCASFNEAIADTLAIKLKRALSLHPVSAIWLAGGVAANSVVRNKIAMIARDNNLKLIMPSPSLCTDNAAMIAYTGYLLTKAGFYHTMNLTAIPRGHKIPEDMRNINYAS